MTLDIKNLLKKIDNYFDNVSDTELEIDLEESGFNYYNKIDDFCLSNYLEATEKCLVLWSASGTFLIQKKPATEQNNLVYTYLNIEDLSTNQYDMAA